MCNWNIIIIMTCSLSLVSISQYTCCDRRGLEDVGGVEETQLENQLARGGPLGECGVCCTDCMVSVVSVVLTAW